MVLNDMVRNETIQNDGAQDDTSRNDVARGGMAASGKRILQPGRNCWRIAHAGRFRMLVDADIYFRAVRAAIREARHSVFILSWDIDSRMRLVPGGAGDGYPEPLAEFLDAAIERRPGLKIYILNWDFAMLYALEREWLAAYRLGWATHPNLEFFMDGKHPLSASHHQKVLVVDDRLAFVGGLDLTRSRWDTPEHRCNAPLRHDVDGKPYGPFHDVQAMVDGAAAAALGELVRERWRRATGQVAVAPMTGGDHDPWPADIAPDLCDVDVGIARTEPAYAGRPGVSEVKQLHLDAIAAAQRTLFFENQYFTSDLICNALSARLRKPGAPEVAIISPRNQSGWLEQATMGVLRARVHARLKAADAHGRYRIYCPELPDLPSTSCLNVHSKVFAVDDTLFCVGSANLSNRSMFFDTECNLVIEAQGERAAKVRHAIRQLRNTLLAEHLATAPERVQAELDQRGSLHAAIAVLGEGGRELAAFDPVTTPELDALIPDQAVIDPERPVDYDELVAQLVPGETRQPVSRRMIAFGMFACVLAALAIAWRWTPLGEWVDLESLLALARRLEALPFTPIAVLLGYVVAGLLMVPVMLMIAVTGIVFGPLEGGVYAMGGAMLSASVSYGLGRWLGRDMVQRLVGRRIDKLSQHLARRGIVSVVVIRMLPIAPFTVVNVIAGASMIRLRDYLIGTLLGMAPGIGITVTFVHHLAEAVRNPRPQTVALLVLVAALLIGTAILVQRMLERRNNSAARRS